MRFRDGSAAVIAPGSSQERLVIPGAPAPTGEFTIEAYVTLKSAPDSDGVCTIVSQGAARAGEPGWTFGVTGKRSHMPQTLVLKLSTDGREAGGAGASET